MADDEPMTRVAAGPVVAEALGVRAPHPLPKILQAASPKSAKLLMRSLRISNGKLRAASGWRPFHPSIRGSWAT